MRFGVVLIGLTVVFGAIWMSRPAEHRLPLPVQQATAGAPAALPDAHAPAAQWFAPVDGTPAGTVAVPAWTSMAEARVHGDPRSPPLGERTAAQLAPTAAQLADPKAYRAYEQSQHARTLAAFADAAGAALPKLRADVERARTSGIAPADIRKVEEKIRRLEHMQRVIVEEGRVPED